MVDTQDVQRLAREIWPWVDDTTTFYIVPPRIERMTLTHVPASVEVSITLERYVRSISGKTEVIRIGASQERNTVIYRLWEDEPTPLT